MLTPAPVSTAVAPLHRQRGQHAEAKRSVPKMSGIERAIEHSQALCVRQRREQAGGPAG